MPTTVLDSFALIAYFRGEPVGVPVKELLQKASRADRTIHMTEVNYAEAKYMILRKDGAQAWAHAADILVALPVEFHPGDRELADVAADFQVCRSGLNRQTWRSAATSLRLLPNLHNAREREVNQ